MGFSDMESFHAAIYGCSECDTHIGHKIECKKSENPKDGLRSILMDMLSHFKNKPGLVSQITIERSHSVIVFDGHHQWHLRALRHPAWNNLTLDILGDLKINILGFKIDPEDTSLWGDVHCEKWLNETYGNKVFM